MKNNIDEIINRVLAGESSADDDLMLIEWLEKDEKNLREFAEKERLWNAIEILCKREKFDYRIAFEKFKTKASSSRRKSAKLSLYPGMIFRWAAIGLVLIGLGSLLTLLLKDHLITKSTDVYELIVPQGSRSNMILADGTSVWLNAGSRLSYSHNFGKDDRTVHLEGEGFFDVVNNDDEPFIVIASQLELVALGTTFNVKSYPKEGIVQTTLVSGSLLVNRSMYKDLEKGLILEPNQQITYHVASDELAYTREKEVKPEVETVKPVAEKIIPEPEPPKLLLRRDINPEIFTSWKDNKLIFDDETFESITAKLERRYGANIVIRDDEMKGKRFKGRFDEVTLEQALNALKFASPFEYYISNDTVFITYR